jgi:hypothetical protein
MAASLPAHRAPVIRRRDDPGVIREDDSGGDQEVDGLTLDADGRRWREVAEREQVFPQCIDDLGRAPRLLKERP